MNEQPSCPRCGYVGPADARYCAQCGRAFLPVRQRLADSANRLLDGVTQLHTALVVLVGLVLLGWLAEWLLVSAGLYFTLSQALLVIVIGLGGGWLGWLWHAPLSRRGRLGRVVLTLGAMALLCGAIWQVDRLLLGLVPGDRAIVSDIPGVHLEASGGYKRMHHVSSPPPYWLITIVWAGLAALLGRGARGYFDMDRRESRDSER